MAKPSAKKRPAASRSRREEDTVEVLDALADRLSSLGRRKWKVKELAAALRKAADGLKNEDIRSFIHSNLEQCAQQLQDKLLALQAVAGQSEEALDDAPQQAAKAAKPSKRSKKAAHEEQPPPSLASAAGYRQLVSAAAAGQANDAVSTTALLLSRKLPEAELVAAHVQRLQPTGDHTGSSEQQQQQPGQLVAAAAAALSVCSALAAEAATPADAVRMFAPAVARLNDATEVLAGGQVEGAAQQLQELGQLAHRTLASMHAALQRQQLALRSGHGSSSGACFWRSTQHPFAAAAAESACSVGAAICALRATLRMRSLGGQPSGRQQEEALSAGVAADLRLLAPYAASGQLIHLATLPLEEAQADTVAARRFLVLYGGAAQQGLSGPQDYLARLVAARKAAAVAGHVGEEALAGCTLEQAASLPTSQGFVDWLHEQPPSGIVSAALAASRQGPAGLSAYLVQECSDRGLRALLAAMQHGGAVAGGEAAADRGPPAEGEGVLDDLLFFADKEGDATMFGRDWQMDGEEDDNDGEEQEEGAARGKGWGVQLDELPEEGGRLSADPGSD